jgi:hypothetical protein
MLHVRLLMQKLPTVRPALSDLTFSTGTDTGKKNI